MINSALLVFRVDGYNQGIQWRWDEDSAEVVFATAAMALTVGTVSTRAPRARWKRGRLGRDVGCKPKQQVRSCGRASEQLDPSSEVERLIANDALYQLSYTPENAGDIIAPGPVFSTRSEDAEK